MANSKEDSFSKRMRKETRDVHKVSDALINAKLVFGKNIFLLYKVQRTQHCEFIFSFV